MQGPSFLGQGVALFKPHFLVLKMKINQLDWICPYGKSGGHIQRVYVCLSGTLGV